MSNLKVQIDSRPKDDYLHIIQIFDRVMFTFAYIYLLCHLNLKISSIIFTFRAHATIEKNISNHKQWGEDKKS